MMLLLIATVLATCVVSFLLWLCITRKPSHITVNCWFCNENTVVPYSNKECWDCPSCQQYNGFDEDGDYNKPIPAQYQRNFNHSVVADYHQQYSQTTTQGDDSVLCELCNRNQLLKVKQLAAFTPSNEADYDAEIEEFKEELEELYKLCLNCELILKQEIRHQTQEIQSRILGRQLKTSSVKGFKMNMSASTKTSWSIFIPRIIAVGCAVFIFLGKHNQYLEKFINVDVILQKDTVLQITMAVLKTLDPYVWLLTACGMLSSNVVLLVSHRKRMSKADQLSSLSWLLLFVYSLDIPFSSPWQPWHKPIGSLLSLTCLFVCICCFVKPRSPTRSQPRSRKQCVRTCRNLSNSNLSVSSSDNISSSVTEDSYHEDDSFTLENQSDRSYQQDQLFTLENQSDRSYQQDQSFTLENQSDSLYQRDRSFALANQSDGLYQQNRSFALANQSEGPFQQHQSFTWESQSKGLYQQNQSFTWQSQSMQLFKQGNHRGGFGGFSTTSVMRPSMSANPSILRPSVLANQSLIRPSMSANQRILKPSILTNQRKVKSSMSTNQSIVKPSVLANERRYDIYANSSVTCFVSANQKKDFLSFSSFSMNSVPAQEGGLSNMLDAMSIGLPPTQSQHLHRVKNTKTDSKLHAE